MVEAGFVDFGSGPASLLLHAWNIARTGLVKEGVRSQGCRSSRSLDSIERQLRGPLKAGRQYALVCHRDRYEGGPWVLYADPDGSHWLVDFGLAVTFLPSDSAPNDVLSRMGVERPGGIERICDVADLDDLVLTAYLCCSALPAQTTAALPDMRP